MSEVRRILEDLRGDEPKGAFAKRLGISWRMLNALYAGEKQPGRKVLTGLLREYPHRRDDIASLFLAPVSHDIAMVRTIERDGGNGDDGHNAELA